MKVAAPYFLFIKHLIIVVLLIIVFDFFFGKGLAYLYTSQEGGTKYRTTYALDSTKAEIIILGSSRASHHYVSDILARETALTVFNSGRDGTNIFYSYALLTAIEKRHSIKLLIVDINSSDFYEFPGKDESVTSLLPYYSTHPELQKPIETMGSFEKVKQLSFIYPYNSTLLSSLGNIYKADRSDDKGYIPLIGKLSDETIDSLNFKKYKPNYINIDLLKQILAICKKSHIEVLVIQSPRYEYFLNDTLSKEISLLVQNMQGKYISFVNNDYYFNHPELFKDPSHLNNEGAMLFTKNLVKNISNYKQLNSSNFSNN